MICDSFTAQRLNRHSQHLMKLLETLTRCTEQPSAPRVSDGPGRRNHIRFSLGEGAPAVAQGQAEFSRSGQLTRLNAVIVRRGVSQDYRERVSVDLTEQHRRMLLTTSVRDSQREYHAGTWTLTEDRQTGAVDYEYQGPKRIGLGNYGRATLMGQGSSGRKC